MNKQARKPRPLWEQKATWCVHYNGTGLNKECRLGISYDSVLNKEGAAGQRFPCLKEAPSDPTRTELCPSATYLTEEQAREKAAEMERYLAAMFKKMADGICTTCDQKVERRRQVGRCVYAEPCGHRIGQGRA